MWLVLAAIVAIGISFYLRFLIALCMELRFIRVGYFVRIEPTVHEGVPNESVREERTFRRAA